MKTKTFLLCEKCDFPIRTPGDGLIFQGNVYRANPDTREGLIGYNFPTQGAFTPADVHEVCYCNTCARELLFGEDD